MDHNDDVQKVAELIKGIRTTMMTTVDAVGVLISRPMAVQDVEFDGDLWLFSDPVARKVSHISADPRVNLSFASSSTWVSLAGSASVVNDPAKRDELWNPFVDAWFPDGKQSASLIRVPAESAEYWDTPGGLVVSAINFGKAKLTGQRYDGGENEQVDLSK